MNKLNQFNLESLGVQEMTRQEMREAYGGKVLGCGWGEGEIVQDGAGCAMETKLYIFGIPVYTKSQPWGCQW